MLSFSKMILTSKLRNSSKTWQILDIGGKSFFLRLFIIFEGLYWFYSLIYTIYDFAVIDYK